MDPLGPYVPRSYRSTRTRQAAFTDRHHLINVTAPAPTIPPLCRWPSHPGRRTGDGDVTAHAHQGPRCRVRAAMRAADRSADKCLRRRSEVEADPLGDPNLPCPRIEVNMPVPDDRAERPRRKRRSIPDLIEIAVVAECRHGIADGRVNGPMGPLRDVDGHLKSLEEQWGDRDG